MGTEKFVALYVCSGVSGNVLSCIIDPLTPVRVRETPVADKAWSWLSRRAAAKAYLPVLFIPTGHAKQEDLKPGNPMRTCIQALPPPPLLLFRVCDGLNSTLG